MQDIYGNSYETTGVGGKGEDYGCDILVSTDMTEEEIKANGSRKYFIIDGVKSAS